MDEVDHRLGEEEEVLAGVAAMAAVTEADMALHEEVDFEVASVGVEGEGTHRTEAWNVKRTFLCAERLIR